MTHWEIPNQYCPYCGGKTGIYMGCGEFQCTRCKYEWNEPDTWDLMEKVEN